MKKFFGILFLCLFVGGASFAGAWWWFDKNAPKPMPVEDLAKLEQQSVIKKVNAHLVLPTDEVPTLATVSDPDRLKEYPFFAKARKGDKVLMYGLSKKAILYRPSEDKIVEMAPIGVTPVPSEGTEALPADLLR